MQTRNKIMDDISQLMTNAMGVAQGAKEEAETAMKSMMDRWLADRDLVTREELGAEDIKFFAFVEVSKDLLTIMLKLI